MGLRILLVHANPFQAVLPVQPYGLERIATAVADLAEIDALRIYDPWLEEDDPLETAAALAEEFRPDLVGLSIRVIDDCIVIDTLDDVGPMDNTCLLPRIAELLQTFRSVRPRAQYVCGGAAFSALPTELLEYFQVEIGIVGAGEVAFRALVRTLARGRSPLGLPGVARRGDPHASAQYQLAFPSQPTKRLGGYSIFSGVPLRTRIGCAMECSYCLTANQRRRRLNGDVEVVLHELEELGRHAWASGVPRAPVMLADDEVNLPGDDSWRRLLRALAERPEISEHVSWRGYINPIPFDEELAELVNATNGHLCLTVDSAADDVLAKNGKPFRRRHLDRTVELCIQRGVRFNVGLIFGLPGETLNTIEATAVWAERLPDAVVVDYAPAARVYPRTPLAAIARKEPARVNGDSTFLFSATFSSPLPPRSLARLLDERFSASENVRRIGDGYVRADRAPARLARLLRAPPSPQTATAFGAIVAGMTDEAQPAASTFRLGRAEHSALWVGRYDLAAVACAEHARAAFVDGTTRSALVARASEHRRRACSTRGSCDHRRGAIPAAGGP
jgi:hypothetical protein